MNREKLGKIVCWTALCTLFTGFMIGILHITMYRFANPDLTETQLFLDLWLNIVVMSLGLGAIAVLLKVKERFK